MKANPGRATGCAGMPCVCTPDSTRWSFLCHAMSLLATPGARQTTTYRRSPRYEAISVFCPFPSRKMHCFSLYKHDQTDQILPKIPMTKDASPLRECPDHNLSDWYQRTR